MKRVTISFTLLCIYYAGCGAPPQNASPEVITTEESRFAPSTWVSLQSRIFCAQTPLRHLTVLTIDHCTVIFLDYG